MTPDEALTALRTFLTRPQQQALGKAMGGDYLDRAIQCAELGDDDGAQAVMDEWVAYARGLDVLAWEQMFQDIGKAGGILYGPVLVPALKNMARGG